MPRHQSSDDGNNRAANMALSAASAGNAEYVTIIKCGLVVASMLIDIDALCASSRLFLAWLVLYFRPYGRVSRCALIRCMFSRYHH